MLMKTQDTTQFHLQNTYFVYVHVCLSVCASIQSMYSTNGNCVVCWVFVNISWEFFIFCCTNI